MIRVKFLVFQLNTHNFRTRCYSCPSDWINGGEIGCFHFGIESGPVDWENALLHCVEFEGGSLAEIPNEETQKFLEEEASANHDEYHFWLGAHDYTAVSILKIPDTDRG